MASNDETRNGRKLRVVHAKRVEQDSAAELPELKVRDLTLMEKLLLSRRRLNMSQEEMAAMLNIHRTTYNRIEQHGSTELMEPDLGGLSVPEVCFIMRKRAGMTQAECAQEMGVTRLWYNQMEQGIGSVDPLVNYWSNYARRQQQIS